MPVVMRARRGPAVILGHRECSQYLLGEEELVLERRQQWSQGTEQKGRKHYQRSAIRIWGEEKGILGKPKVAVVGIMET